jgi:hypothetical protein
LRKSTPFQWLGGTKRSLRSRFLSFAPAERLERPSVSGDKNSVSQIDGCLFRKAAGSVQRQGLQPLHKSSPQRGRAGVDDGVDHREPYCAAEITHQIEKAARVRYAACRGERVGSTGPVTEGTRKGRPSGSEPVNSSGRRRRDVNAACLFCVVLIALPVRSRLVSWEIARAKAPARLLRAANRSADPRERALGDASHCWIKTRLRRLAIKLTQICQNRLPLN